MTGLLDQLLRMIHSSHSATAVFGRYVPLPAALEALSKSSAAMSDLVVPGEISSAITLFFCEPRLDTILTRQSQDRDLCVVAAFLSAIWIEARSKGRECDLWDPIAFTLFASALEALSSEIEISGFSSFMERVQAQTSFDDVLFHFLGASAWICVVEAHLALNISRCEALLIGPPSRIIEDAALEYFGSAGSPSGKYSRPILGLLNTMVDRLDDARTRLKKISSDLSSETQGEKHACRTIEAQCRHVAVAAAGARLGLRALSGAERDGLLRAMAAALRADTLVILEANRKDVEAGSALSLAMLDRLRLDAGRIESMASAVEQIAAQPDPVGAVLESRRLASGIQLEKRRVPLGVVLIIYESRPNVTSDAAALCIRSGNAVVLRGGKEAAATNQAIAESLRGALRPHGLENAVGFVETTDRDAINCLVRMEGIIDLVIPRGGPGLIRAVTDAARIPVVKHDAGNCHVYVDEHLDGLEDAAERVVVNAKVQRPGVCNAAEKLLVHSKVAARMLPRLCAALRKAGVELRGDERARAIAPSMVAATETDWATEYLDLVMAIRVVDSLEEAAAHIRRWGSQHTEAIITSSSEAAERFIALVDSASVMVNCSTRFADGGEIGLGAEIGISTSKLHSRGPMGAADLTTTQWVLVGDGQVRR